MTVVNDTRQADGKATLKDSNVVSRMLADPGARARHRRELVALAQRNGFTGIDVDYEKSNVRGIPFVLDTTFFGAVVGFTFD